MVKRIFFAAIIGGFIAFIWGNISWVVLDLHQKTLLQFKDDSSVATNLKENALQSGVYFLPHHIHDTSGKSPEEQKTLRDTFETHFKQGPRAFVAVALGPGDPRMVHQIIQYLLTFFVYGLALAIMLASCSCGGYFCRVLYVGFVGLLMGSYGDILGVTWFHFSWDFALMNALDGLIAWTLAGLAMAAIVKKSTKCA